MLIGFMTFRQLDPSPHAEVRKIMFSNEVRFRLDLIAPKGNDNESNEKGRWTYPRSVEHWDIDQFRNGLTSIDISQVSTYHCGFRLM